MAGITGNTTAALPAAATAAQPAAAAAAQPAATATATQPQTQAQNTTVAREIQAQAVLNQAFQTEYKLSAPGGPGQLTLTGGINMLTDIFSVRQKRLADISLALANYTSTTGNVNQAAVQKVMQENSANDALNSLTSKLFEKQQDAIRTWLQIR